MEVVKIDPANAKALYNLGLTFKAKGLNEDAVISYLAALKADPAYSEVHYTLGDAYLALGSHR